MHYRIVASLIRSSNPPADPKLVLDWLSGLFNQQKYQGRILIVLYLAQVGLLNYPILFISGFINQNRSDYYRLVREVTTNDNWCEFIEYLLRGIYLQARETKEQLFKVMDLFNSYREGIKTKCRSIYSSDLVEQLFSLPIVTPVRLGNMLNVHYTTATRYLKQLEKEGFLQNQQVGKYQVIHQQAFSRFASGLDANL